ncbi:MAG TPA: hypothetical protein VKA53_05530, partial [Thermoanaerobaculia bacterium]|nr:hypothetical protein [Thermoanaerobaculia bacterium]
MEHDLEHSARLARSTKEALDDAQIETADARDQIRREHENLHNTIGFVEQTSDLRVLLPMLADLRSQLEHHFTHEEGPEGLHDAIGDSAPHLLTAVQRLFEEHRNFLSTLDQLIEEAQACWEGPLADILRRAEALCRRLGEHEAEETEL